MHRFSLLTFILVSAFVHVSAPGATAEPHTVPRIQGPIKIDAVLDEPAWRHALSLQLDVEVRPGENIPPPVATEVLVCYDDRFLYAAFRAADPDPSQIRARFADRDQLFNDDWVALVLDTFNDDRRAFQFFVNPLGIQADSIESNVGGGGTEWDAIWDSAGRILEDGYVVEMAIPFSSLRFQPAEGDQTWGFDAVRSYPRLVKHHIGLFPRDRSNNCYLCQADKIRGFAGGTPGRNMEFTPTLRAYRNEGREPFPEGSLIEQDSGVELGFTARWGVTPNLNVSAIVNPDFSQIEADAAQLDINNQFSLFYPEKRPFFLEGIDYFDTPINAIYTRTLVKPKWGVKTAGKVGANAIGFYSVRDDVTHLLLPAAEFSSSAELDTASQATVLRYRRDVGTASVFGGLATDREGNDYHNRVLGGDVDLLFSATDRLSLQVTGSRTLYPNDVAEANGQPLGEFDGHAVDLFYAHTTRSWEAYAKYKEVSPGFRADLGFEPRAGFKFYDAGYLFILQKDDPHHWYNKLRVWFGYERDTDSENQMLRSAPGTFVEYNGPMQAAGFAILYYGEESYLGEQYDHRIWDVRYNFHPLRDLELGLRVLGGDRVDYRHGRPGKRLRVVPTMALYAGSRLSFDLVHTYEVFDVDQGRMYEANLTELRTEYHFNRRAYLRLILQHADYEYEPEQYADPIDPEFRHLLTQLLFTYKLNPWTALYIGYSDNYRADSQVDLTQSDRTAFVKIGYAWVP